MKRRFQFRAESWPLARPFRISRGTKSSAEVVIVEIKENGQIGHGECVPYPRYGESCETVMAILSDITSVIENGLDREALRERLPPGAARNALDCALWDLEGKLAGRRVWELAQLKAPRSVITAETVALDSPERMAGAAAALRSRPLLKIKVGREEVFERLAAVREAAPAARLIVDANEGWDASVLSNVAPQLLALGVEMIEQPLPAEVDGALDGYRCPVPLCADESVHTLADLDRIATRYQLINIKLDKAGGLSAAIDLLRGSLARGLGVMVGCMVGTSLSMAPAMLLAPYASVVDLDGPLWLAKDRTPSMIFQDGYVYPPEPALWG
ncbi:MAG: L-Ala-D/L-Glu epimerase [Hyphomicrobiales bacterium]|nr:L-Ala-D/L-Glu epimerase [Hyphomicrobiales bacterium]